MPLAVFLDRLLEVADQRDPIAERPEEVFLEAERLAPFGTGELLLEDVEHAGLELVDQVVDGVVGVVQVPAQRLVAGDRGGDPGLGAQARPAAARRS